MIYYNNNNNYYYYYYYDHKKPYSHKKLHMVWQKRRRANGPNERSVQLTGWLARCSDGDNGPMAQATEQRLDAVSSGSG